MKLGSSLARPGLAPLLLLVLLPGCGLLSRWNAGEEALAARLGKLEAGALTRDRRIRDLGERVDRLSQRLHVAQKRLRRQQETLDGLSSWTMENLLALQTELVRLDQSGVRRSVESVLQERLRETESRIREQAFLAWAAPFLEGIELDDARRNEVVTVLRAQTERLRALFDRAEGPLDMAVQRERQITEDRLAALLGSKQLEAYRKFLRERGVWPPFPSEDSSPISTSSR